MSKFSASIRRNIATILALVVSVLTLFIYVRQTNVLVQQTKANSWPYLMFDKTCVHGGEVGEEITLLDISVSNKGTGPAIVEKVVVRYKNEELERWHDLYKATAVPDSLTRHINHFLDNISNTVLMPGEKVVLAKWHHSPKIATYLYERINDLEIAICYKSVHNDYWTTSRKDFFWSGEVSVEESNGCRLKAEKYFMQ